MKKYDFIVFIIFAVFLCSCSNSVDESDGNSHSIKQENDSTDSNEQKGGTVDFDEQENNADESNEIIDPATQSNTIPETPTNIYSYTISSSCILLSWDEVIGTIGYYVYRSSNGASGTYIRVGITSEPLYQDTELPIANTTYFYKVSAYNNEGEGKSASVSGTTGPPEVYSISVSPNSESVDRGKTLQFSATIIGSNNPPPAQTVTWAVTGGGNGTSINSIGLLTVAANENSHTLLVVATSTANTSVSGFVTVFVIQPPDTKPNVDAYKSTYSTVWLSWNEVSEATGYHIYQSKSSSGTFTLIGTNTTSTSTQFINSGLDVNTAYYYQVSALINGNEGDRSAIISAKTKNAAYIDDFTNGVFAISSSQIVLEWHGAFPVGGYIPVLGLNTLQGYRVMRKTGNSASWQEVAYISTNWLTSLFEDKYHYYIDKELSPSTTYEYEVRAIYGFLFGLISSDTFYLKGSTKTYSESGGSGSGNSGAQRMPYIYDGSGGGDAVRSPYINDGGGGRPVIERL